MEIKKFIALTLFDLRNDEGYNRENFAELAGISLNAYASIENGKSLIKIDTLHTLLSELSLPLSVFFRRVEAKIESSK
ncbi:MULTISPECIES: helix-turn-helix domain-containing protein [Bacteria]|uniref:HTH cro/C1-type domain-containing protein n=1 Tax=Bacillus cereus VD184 TaxID=1053242 RepID=A0A9W5VU53_BACCE|nr:MULTISPECIES: helix-turn-helix transcriptional regulator [Bacillus cereus group]EOQ17204.1 hypothetical protein IKC_01942 [Bacillus cereus VD184]MCU5203401.1 helix-turn-helix transcriptional regulator [Bacillus paranthracis]HDR7764594.1 helix-turn-helix transcriptional regulator [Bacillus paranthracis]